MHEKKDPFSSLDTAFERGGRNLLGVAGDLPRIFDLALEYLEADPEQPRKTIDEDTLQELADSIERHGVLQPIIVRKHDDQNRGNEYIVVAGERRYRACKKLGKRSIPAIRTKGDPSEISLIENVQREDLKPLEEARAYQRLLKKHNYTHDDLAGIVGKARTTITRALRLNTLPDDIQAECATSHIVPKSILIELSEIDDPIQQRSLWENIKGGGFTVKDVRAKRKSANPGDTTDRAKPSPVTQAVSAARTLVHKLENIGANDIADNRDNYEELIRLRDQIDKIIDDATAERQQL